MINLNDLDGGIMSNFKKIKTLIEQNQPYKLQIVKIDVETNRAVHAKTAHSVKSIKKHFRSNRRSRGFLEYYYQYVIVFPKKTFDILPYLKQIEKYLNKENK